MKLPTLVKIITTSLHNVAGKLHISPGELRFNGRYRLGKLLGRGAYGNVYEGYRIKDGLKVAVKKIPKKNILHMEGKVPLEVALLKKLEDVPGVVHLVECIDMGDGFAIVFENDGIYKDLFDVIIENGKLEEDFTKAIFQQIVKSVIMCHSRGVLHRDIKDENIVINMNTLEAKLIDFGSSCIIQNESYCEFEGTPVYAPPEWVEEKKYMAEDITVWELGILLFDMVCGNIPFLEEKQIVEGKLEWMAEVSAELQDLVEKCLCHNPGQRICLKDILKHPWFL